MLKRLFKPDKKKILLTIVLFILGTLAAGIYFLAWPSPLLKAVIWIYLLPKGALELLMPELFQQNMLVFIIVELLWSYLLSIFLIELWGPAKRNLKKIDWSSGKVIITGVVLIIFLSLYGFFHFSGDILAPTADDSGATQEGVSKVVEANNKFAFNLYSKIAEKSGGNIFFSPWSISNAMIMAYEGARGDTAAEIRRVFHFPNNDSLRRASFARMLNTLNKAGGEYDLKIANAMWLQEGYPFREKYKETISTYYLGNIDNLDLQRNSQESSSKINDWVSDNTNDKIEEIVSPGDLKESVLLLTNAIYFKGKWKEKFDEEKTKQEEFILPSGERVEVPMMRPEDSDQDFNYTESDGIQILEMPYEGNKISMLVLLPKIERENSGRRVYGKPDKLGNMTHLESILSTEKLQEWRKGLRPRSVSVYMPKYTFETEYSSLSEMLREMGMNTSFSPQADFSGIGKENSLSPDDTLYINDIRHKAYIKVNEEGTEAAAATSVGLVQTSIPLSLQFRADHPFIFLIQERKTGNVLFMGKVNDPRG